MGESGSKKGTRNKGGTRGEGGEEGGERGGSVFRVICFCLILSGWVFGCLWLSGVFGCRLQAADCGIGVSIPIPHEGFPQSHAVQDQNKFVKSIHVEKVPQPDKCTARQRIRINPSAS